MRLINYSALLGRLGHLLKFKLVFVLSALIISAIVAGCATAITESMSEDFALPEPPVAEVPLDMPDNGTIDPPEPPQADPIRGELIYLGQEGMTAAACSACHLTSDAALVGPGFSGLYGRAGDRSPGISAEEYVIQSIRQPSVFILDGYTNIMPVFDESQLDERDLADLLAFLEGL